MSKIVLLTVHNLVRDLLVKPLYISRVRQSVRAALEHSSRQVEMLQGHLGWLDPPVDRNVIHFAVVELSELIVNYILSEVGQILVA